MKLREQIKSDIKEALKKNQKDRLAALRLFQSAVQEKEIQKKPEPLIEADIFSVLKKQVKQYEESVKELTHLQRVDKAETEITKIQYLKDYLPPALSTEELTKIIQEEITKNKAISLKDQGLVIRAVQKRANGIVDNLKIVQIVREHLQK